MNVIVFYFIFTSFFPPVACIIDGIQVFFSVFFISAWLFIHSPFFVYKKKPYSFLPSYV